MPNPTVGSQKTFVPGTTGVVTLNGNVYAATQQFKMEWGNDSDRELVGGTDSPVVTTSGFAGRGEVEVVYSTENTAAKEQFSALASPVNGEVPKITLTWQGEDISGTKTTFFIVGVKPTNVSIEQNGPRVVKAKMICVMVSRPLFSSSLGTCISWGLDTPPNACVFVLDVSGVLDT
jgi:hypothetical protein